MKKFKKRVLLIVVLVSMSAVSYLLAQMYHLHHVLATMKKNNISLKEKHSHLSHKYQHVIKQYHALQQQLKQKDQTVNELNHKVSKLKKDLKKKEAELAEHEQWQPFVLTYYDANEQSTGKNPGDPGYGITASGRPATEGVTIAVDPAIIPLGSWVQIRFPDGHIETRRADDTGSEINGHHIDYYVPHASLAMGKKTVHVKIMSKKE